ISIFQNLKSGLDVIRTTDVLRSLFIAYFFIGIIFGFSNAIRLPFAVNALNATEFDFAMIESVTLVGFVIASLLMAQLGDRLREGQWLAISIIGMSMTGVAFSLSTSVNFALIFITIEGFVNAPSVIARALIIQRHTPRDARGRVFSAFFVTRDVMFMIGMSMAGLADLFDARWLYLISSLFILGIGIAILFMPGLGQPAAEWRRAITLLRATSEYVGIGIGRVLTSKDFERLLGLVPQMGELSPEMQKRLISKMTFHEVGEGTTIIRRNETSDSAFFILSGQAFAGWDDQGSTKLLETLRAGDFFGEIAALTGAIRTANVITAEPCTLVRVPAPTLREMASDPQLNRIFVTRMTERMIRMNMIDVARLGHFDQKVLHELRTAEHEAN
ncbi:MAG TPA: cyclic nucleotide-binding domain-containing protein, partial [Pseudomonadales bacterium]|nr:cyclic nucleotide-binding domain-containing protein [Pseudomonadales bacterium]